MKIKLSVLGVRGAIPAANRDCMDYGGNTSCISLEYGEELVCFDAGTGLAGLIGRLDGVKRLDILISHVHIDHILGLLNLSALHGPEIHLYGEAVSGTSFRKCLETVNGRPYWPLGLNELPEGIHIHEITEGDKIWLPVEDHGGIKVCTMHGNHPGGSLLYRAEIHGVRVTYALDCEMDDATFSALAEFSRGSQLLIWDANFTNTDKKPGWGHSTWEEGIALGRAAHAERILMTHYSRDYTDSFLWEQEQLACKEESACIFSREGMVIEL